MSSLPAILRSEEVAMATIDTEYSWRIPEGTREFALILQDRSVEWRFSATPGQVATGGGTPRGPGQSVSYENGLYVGVVYFAHSSGSAQVMRIEYAREGG